jgi:hypothetical protein
LLVLINPWIRCIELAKKAKKDGNTYLT